jgi:hypothetical protein
MRGLRQVLSAVAVDDRCSSEEFSQDGDRPLRHWFVRIELGADLQGFFG